MNVSFVKGAFCRLFFCAAALMLVLISECSTAQDNTSSAQTEITGSQKDGTDTTAKTDTEAADVIDNTAASQEHTETEGEELSMKIIISGTEYDVEFDDNVTSEEIIEKLPLELSMVRYAGHEYYSELPFTPTFSDETTSNIKAGHVYYWDGWNAFVINFEDYDITPYKVVHIGEIRSESISEILRSSEDTIDIQVK